MNPEIFWSQFVKVWTGYWQLMVFDGLKVTLEFTAISVSLGVILGTVVAVLKMSRFRVIRFFVTVYIEVLRGTPILLQLYIFVFALPLLLPVKMSNYFWVAVALSINSSAYVSEIIRAGIQAVDRGQTEAARSLGLSGSQTMARVVLPQAVRNILPALGNEFIMMLKETSLASTFYIGDLMTTYLTIRGATMIALPTLLIVGLIYLAVTYPLSKLVGLLEKKLSGEKSYRRRRRARGLREAGERALDWGKRKGAAEHG